MVELIKVYFLLLVSLTKSHSMESSTGEMFAFVGTYLGTPAGGAEVKNNLLGCLHECPDSSCEGFAIKTSGFCVVETDPNNLPPGQWWMYIRPAFLCPAGWFEYGHNCLRIYTVSSATQTKTENFCRDLGGNVATIDSQEIMDFIRQQMNHAGALFYLGNKEVAGVWQGIDGSPLSWTSWSPGEPSGDEPCIMLVPGKDEWNDITCNNEVDYQTLCEIPRGG